MNSISLKFMIEKREGHGEDSPALSLIKENFCAVGVFDGMGGSGAAICKSEFEGDHTKAYVASRIILEAINNYMKNAKDVRDINSDVIKSTAHGRLEQEKSKYPTKASRLRSKLVRDYPTTLAITTALQNGDGTHTVNSYWAGDSRNYLWTPEGFYQISKDDLDTELDPLENLRNDGALSNCICADREFIINNKSITVEGKFVILSATDGCFNYFATPMHFNDVLVTGLKQSDSVEEWENYCKSVITDVTGDDVSLSLIAVGFEDFKDLKESLSNSSVVKIEEIKKVQNELKYLSKQIEDNKAALENLIQEGWDEYKTSYMKYFNSEEIREEDTEKITEEEIAESSTPTGEDCSRDNRSIEDGIDENKDNTLAEKPIVELGEVSHADCSVPKKEESTFVSSVPSEEDKENVPSEDMSPSIEKNETPIETEADKTGHDELHTNEKDITPDTTNIKRPIKEVPKFGRVPIKTTSSSTLRMGSSTRPSNIDINRMVDQFMKTPSIETANVLMDLILDYGESMINSIPRAIRNELKKFKK